MIDPIERIVAAALDAAGIPYRVGVETGALDFEIIGTGVFIECKQFPTDRTSEQIAPFPNVIVIQGRAAAEMFAQFVARGLAVSGASTGGPKLPSPQA